MIRKGSKSTPGTAIKVGDRLLGFGGASRGVVTKTIPDQHELGARYLDVTFDDGSVHRCWQGILYHVECETQ